MKFAVCKKSPTSSPQMFFGRQVGDQAKTGLISWKTKLQLNKIYRIDFGVFSRRRFVLLVQLRLPVYSVSVDGSSIAFGTVSYY